MLSEWAVPHPCLETLAVDKYKDESIALCGAGPFAAGPFPFVFLSVATSACRQLKASARRKKKRAHAHACKLRKNGSIMQATKGTQQRQYMACENSSYPGAAWL